MPTNLPPQYFEAEKLYRQARTPADKLEALESMLAIMPKHKGTDHLRAQLRARIASVTQEAQRQTGGGARAWLVASGRQSAAEAWLRLSSVATIHDNWIRRERGDERRDGGRNPPA